MTPAEQLAAARANVVGSYLPARLEWLERWCGPCLVDGVPSIVAGPCGAGRASVVTAPRAVGPSAMYATPIAAITLDPHHPEVRDHLVRMGCPAQLRDVLPAVWCWGMDACPLAVLPPWRWVNHPAEPWERRFDLDNRAEVYRGGWVVQADGRTLARSSIFECADMEPVDLRDECDLAALNAGCILREPGGWLVPLPGGGIGFFKEVSRDE